jgi:hypothetical protein
MRGAPDAPVLCCVHATRVNEPGEGLPALLAEMVAARRAHKRPVNGAVTDGRTWIFVRLVDAGYWSSLDITRPAEALYVLRRWLRGDVVPEWQHALA